MNVNLPKTGVFADVQNIYYTCKQAYNKQFNYRYLWQQLNRKYCIETANAYAIDSNNDGQHKFQTALRSLGFNVKLKPYIQRQDGSAKGDWDVGITIDIIEAAERLDHIILLSGDGDFDLLLRYISEKHGVSTQVIGVEALTAKSLIDSCGEFQKIGSDLLL